MNKKLILALLIILTVSRIGFSADIKNIIAGISADPVSLDPAEPWDDSSSLYINAIFNTLVDLEPSTMKVIPSLAISWKSYDQGKEWRFKLRKGVFFHDGTPFNADSVLFTFNRLLDKKFNYRFYDFPLFDEIFFVLKSVKKIDNHAISFRLSEPFPSFPATLSVDCVSIISPAAVKKYLVKFREHPVGTGPFKFGLWREGERIELCRNNEYWGKKPQYSKYITLIKSNFDSLLSSFMKKKLDILLSFSISRLLMLKGMNWVGRVESMDLSSNFIAFNFRNPYLKHLKFRKALNYLWNPKILKIVFQEYVFPLHSIIPIGMVGSSSNNLYPYSIQKAKTLLNEIGIKKRISLGFLIMTGTGLDLQTIILYAKNLKKIGVDLEIERVKTEEEYAEKILKGDFDLTYSGWIPDYPDPDSMIRPLFSKKLHDQGFANFSGWKNKKLRKLIERARKERDNEVRLEDYKKINKIVLENALCIPIFQNKSVIIFNKRIRNPEITPYGGVNILSLGKR